MDKETSNLNTLSKEELIGIINSYKEKLALNEECRELLRIDARCM